MQGGQQGEDSGSTKIKELGQTDLQGGSEGITQAVFRLRQASQGRFLRLRGSRARPNWLWMVNLRGRPWAESAPLSMSWMFHGQSDETTRAGPSLAGWLAGLFRGAVGGGVCAIQRRDSRFRFESLGEHSGEADCWLDRVSNAAFHRVWSKLADRRGTAVGVRPDQREPRLSVASNVTGTGLRPLRLLG